MVVMYPSCILHPSCILRTCITTTGVPRVGLYHPLSKNPSCVNVATKYNQSMKRMSTREFNANISRSLKDLPVEITSRGVVVAIVLQPGVNPPRGVFETVDDTAEIPEIAGERSSDKTTSYAPRPLRKKLCRKHSTFSCGCPE